jgi:hypothetical protein
MYNEILGVPGMTLGLAKTKINEAFQLIQDEQMWSFQVQTGGWLTPGILGGQTASFLSPGTITVQPFTNTIKGDAIASAAWAGAVNPSITSYQIRIPYYSLYNIIAFNTVPYPYSFILSDTVTGQLYAFSVVSGAFQFQPVDSGTSIANPIFYDTGFNVYWQVQVTNGGLEFYPAATTANAINQYLVTDTTSNLTRAFQFYEGSFENVPSTAALLGQLTLDRPWMEPGQINSNYVAYQAYFPAPPGFKRWLNIRDTTNARDMNWWEVSQDDLAVEDPQRTNFSQPEYVVAYGPDTRLGSATYGQELFELWEGPISSLPYTFMCQCDLPAFVNPNDTVPFPLTEELVKFRTYEVISLWKEMQKGDDMERGSGANWQFLAKAYREEYESRLKIAKIKDKNIRDMYFQRMMRNPLNDEPFVSVGGQFNVGA